MLVVKMCLGTQEDVEVPEEGALVCVPSRIGVAIEDGKFSLSLDMKVRLDIHTSKGTKLQLIFVGVPNPFIGMGKNTEACVMRADVWKATLYEPGVS